jgi:uncharacterized sulfatase
MKPLLTLLATFSLLASASGAEQRPNLVLILADDLGWADLPAYGNRFHEAPHLTRLAEEGMRFTDAYSANPVCSPTRASLMTGQSSARVGIHDWITGHWRPYEALRVPTNRTQHLPHELTTIAEALQKQGYATAMFGKWHLGHGPAHHPTKHGFDEAYVGQGYFNVRFDPPREASAEKVMAERLTDFGLDFIQRQQQAGKPFFLFLAHWDVHVQLDSDRDTIAKYQRKSHVPGHPGNAVYAASIEQLDGSIGRLLKRLHELGLEESTLVVFTSDNGGQISNEAYFGSAEHGRPGTRMNLMVPDKQDIHAGDARAYIATSNAPLRGEKGTVFEGGIRVPFIVRWPGRVPAATTSAALVSSGDLFPTFIELAGVPREKLATTAGQPLDGASLLPVLLEKAAPDPQRTLFWHHPVYHHGTPAAALRLGSWKLIRDFATGHDTLYDLDADLSETTDLSGVFPDAAKDLATALDQRLADTKAELPVPNPHFDASRRLEWGRHPDGRSSLKPVSFTETFDAASFDAKRFLTPIPNKNTEVRDGVLWTRGASGGKYPPMVYRPVDGDDLDISFRYRHLAAGGWLWFFVDGDDGLGGTDHLLRVKLLRDAVQLQVDGHTFDAAHPQLNPDRPADKISGLFRTNEHLPADKLDLSANDWHALRLVFHHEEVTVSLDGDRWQKTLRRPGLSTAKKKLLWMQNGGQAGIELDDITVKPAKP